MILQGSTRREKERQTEKRWEDKISELDRIRVG